MNPEQFAQQASRLRAPVPAVITPAQQIERLNPHNIPEDPEWPTPISSLSIGDLLKRLPAKAQIICAVTAAEMVVARGGSISVVLLDGGPNQHDARLITFMWRWIRNEPGTNAAAILDLQSSVPGMQEPIVAENWPPIENFLAALDLAETLRVRHFTEANQSERALLLQRLPDRLRWAIAEAFHRLADSFLNLQRGSERYDRAVREYRGMLKEWWQRCRVRLAFADASTAEVSGPEPKYSDIQRALVPRPHTPLPHWMREQLPSDAEMQTPVFSPSGNHPQPRAVVERLDEFDPWASVFALTKLLDFLADTVMPGTFQAVGNEPNAEQYQQAIHAVTADARLWLQPPPPDGQGREAQGRRRGRVDNRVQAAREMSEALNVNSQYSQLDYVVFVLLPQTVRELNNSLPGTGIARANLNHAFQTLTRQLIALYPQSAPIAWRWLWFQWRKRVPYVPEPRPTVEGPNEPKRIPMNYMAVQAALIPRRTRLPLPEGPQPPLTSQNVELPTYERYHLQEDEPTTHVDLDLVIDSLAPEMRRLLMAEALDLSLRWAMLEPESVNPPAWAVAVMGAAAREIEHLRANGAQHIQPAQVAGLTRRVRPLELYREETNRFRQRIYWLYNALRKLSAAYVSEHARDWRYAFYDAARPPEGGPADTMANALELWRRFERRWPFASILWPQLER